MACITDNLFMLLNYGYLDTEYTDYISHESDGAIVDMKGEPISGTPRHKANIALEYTTYMFAPGAFILRADYAWQSKRRDDFRFQDPYEIEAFGIANTRIKYLSEDEKWETAFYVYNVFDEEYLIFAPTGVSNSIGDQVGSPVAKRSAPRLFGLEFRYFF